MSEPPLLPRTVSRHRHASRTKPPCLTKREKGSDVLFVSAIDSVSSFCLAFPRNNYLRDYCTEFLVLWLSSCAWLFIKLCQIAALVQPVLTRFSEPLINASEKNPTAKTAFVNPACLQHFRVQELRSIAFFLQGHMHSLATENHRPLSVQHSNP